MATPVTIDKLPLSGRPNTVPQQAQRTSGSYDADFSSAADVTIQFNTINQAGVFGIPKTLFIDNGSNLSSVEVSCSITNQYFTVPAFAQGYFHLEATENSEIRFVTDGGATETVTITIHNWDVAPNVWYSFGAFNTDIPIRAQGAMDEGDTVAAETYKRPLYIGGIDRATGLFHGIRTDADGGIYLANADIDIGTVKIESAAGVALLFAATNAALAPSATINAPVVNSYERLSSGEAVVSALLASNAGAGVMATGLAAQLDDAAPYAMTEGQFGSLRLSPDRSLQVIIRAVTPTVAAVAVTAGAAAELFAANLSDKGRVIVNSCPDGALFVKFGATASATDYSYVLAPDLLGYGGGTLEVPFGYTGQITGRLAAGSTNSNILCTKVQ